MDIIVRKITQTKGIILLGIIFILALVSIKIGGAKSTVSRQQTVSPTPAAVKHLLKNPNTKATTKFDIKGQYECNYASMSAFISNKRLYVENKKEKIPSYVVYNNDCLYMWQDSVRTGTKKCGLGMYVGMYESFSGLGIVDSGSLLSTVLESGMLDSLLPASGSAGVSSPAEAKKTFAKSCRETNSVNEKIFVAPGNITFTEEKKK